MARCGPRRRGYGYGETTFLSGVDRAAQRRKTNFLDGGHSGGVIPPAEAGDSGVSNSDMGGSDFGMNDPGSGWDDGGGGGGDSGGGGDWS